MVNIDESSKAYGVQGEPGRAPFGRKGVDYSSERLRSNSVEDRPECRSNILPRVDQSINYEKINGLIKKNFSDREALKRDLNNLK